MKLIECVPNFSEGRRKETIDAIANAAKLVAGVTVLDCESDTNHNRMVLTFVGEPNEVKKAALACSAEAIRSIDLTKHTGEHPRMGAVDVVPFVPLKNVTMEECVSIAKEFAQDFSMRFGVPVFLYESAATRPERKDLAKIREGQFEGLRELIGKDQSKTPDYGPHQVHPTAGATAVGARPILIAYNVNLGTTNPSVAKHIAKQVRGRDGGLASVKALGFELKDKNMVQVSMNLTDFQKSSMWKAFELVSSLAEHSGVNVVETEIVGLVPMDALIETAIFYLKLHNFSTDQIIENKIYGITKMRGETESNLGSNSLIEFATKVASESPVPGGGSVSAYTGALAASLVAMVCKLTIGKKEYESASVKIGSILESATYFGLKLQELVEKDADAYSEVMRAMKLPKSTDDEKMIRTQRVNEALKIATEIPLETMQLCERVLYLAREVIEFGNKNARSDAETAIELSKAAALGAWSNIKINLDSLTSDPDFVREIRKKTDEILVRVR